MAYLARAAILRPRRPGYRGRARHHAQHLQHKTHIALGVLGETSLSVLLPPDPSRFGNIDAFAFELFVRSFGPDDTLTQRLIEQIRAWDAAGRPGEENLFIKVYLHDTDYTPVADEVVITNRWTKLAISWRL